jgi:hypothetical protein
LNNGAVLAMFLAVLGSGYLAVRHADIPDLRAD